MSKEPKLYANLFFRPEVGPVVSVSYADSDEAALEVSLEDEFRFMLQSDYMMSDGSLGNVGASEAHQLRVEAGRLQAWADTLRKIADASG